MKTLLRTENNSWKQKAYCKTHFSGNQDKTSS